jgi:hypothetical protein
MLWQTFIAGILYLALLAAAPVAFHARAQSSPQELAQTLTDRWAAGATAKFAAVYPFREGREVLTAVAAGKLAGGLARVIRVSQAQAVLLISGVPLLPNSGDATIMGAAFSGVYESLAEGGTWKLSRRIPLESMGRIFSHDIRVSVLPAHGMTVEDRMHIGVHGRNGFAVRLNYAAKITSISAGGREPDHLFGGGLLWVELPEGETDLTIRYSIEVEKGPQDTNSGCFIESSGHVRNQYFWHPFFGNAAADWADFHIEVRIPKEYRVATSIPQTERVEGDERIVEGRTIQPAFALTLVYDRDWKVESRTFQSGKFGDIRVEFFVSPEMQPDVTAVFAEFRSVYGLLSGRFGAPRGRYFAVIQARSWMDNPGWRFASNQAVVSAMVTGPISTGTPVQLAPLGHEIAHFWTEAATGEARNFLSEGWAVWAESAIVENEFGAEAARSFWKSRADGYFHAYDGKASLVQDELNSGVSYSKGPWLFHMLEEAMGKTGFQQAMAEYSRLSLVNPAGWELLAECAQRYAPADFNARAFLQPWLTETRAPRVATQIAGRTVTIRREPSTLEFPLVLEASVATSGAHERRQVWIRNPETMVTFSGEVTDVKVDPDGDLLLGR